jgi:type I restriction enzyme R subunit
VGVFRNLKEALAIYAQPRPGVTSDPIEGKDALVEALRAALRQAVEFGEARSVRPADALRVTGFERQAALQDAAEKLLGDDEEKRAFLRLVGDAWKLFRAVLPDPVANEAFGIWGACATISKAQVGVFWSSKKINSAPPASGCRSRR